MILSYPILSCLTILIFDLKVLWHNTTCCVIDDSQKTIWTITLEASLFTEHAVHVFLINLYSHYELFPNAFPLPKSQLS